MVLIRVFEEEVERQYKRARIGGYCHLASGQEGATVGAVDPMERDDLLFSSYRTHGLALAKGVDPDAVMGELFGREGGSAHGRGGSMHLLDVPHGFLGGWGIVTGQLPLATGAALALTYRGKRAAVMCELGDAATNMGAWHESLNLAGIWDLPVVFLIFNNRYGMGTTVEKASAEPELYKRASAFKMHGERVDGQDVEAVLEASDRLLTRARNERKPAVLEVITYRYRGHSVADAGTAYRTQEEVEEWRKRDPILIYRRRLMDERGVEESQLRAIEARVEQRVEQSVIAAEASPEPPVDTLARHLYGDPNSAKQFSQMGPGSPFGERELVLGGLGR
ncbi:MAG TPA: thiamine pyrophosphate-dependent enzyme [Conexibacter sp.]|jgi:pyruvate dehydrogenase E1 component alpha subunit